MENDPVRKATLSTLFFTGSLTNKSSIPSLAQVLLVAGGYSGSEQRAGSEVATTELLVAGASAWALVGPLPASMHGLRAAAVDNRVFMFGEEAALAINIRLSISTGGFGPLEGEDGTFIFDWILEFDRDVEIWTEIGKMSQKRAFHAVSPVRFQDISRFCH